MEFTDSHRRSMFGVSRPQAYQFAEIIAEFSIAEAKAISDQAAAVARGKAEETRRKTLLSLAVIANAMSWDQACDYWVHDLRFGDQLSARQARRYFKEIAAIAKKVPAPDVRFDHGIEWLPGVFLIVDGTVVRTKWHVREIGIFKKNKAGKWTEVPFPQSILGDADKEDDWIEEMVAKCMNGDKTYCLMKMNFRRTLAGRWDSTGRLRYSPHNFHRRSNFLGLFFFLPPPLALTPCQLNIWETLKIFK